MAIEHATTLITGRIRLTFNPMCAMLSYKRSYDPWCCSACRAFTSSRRFASTFRWNDLEFVPREERDAFGGPYFDELLIKLEPAYEASYWHNKVFNSQLGKAVNILGFQPDWDEAVNLLNS